MTNYKLTTKAFSTVTVMKETEKAICLWNRSDKSQWFPKSAFSTETSTNDMGVTTIKLTIKDWFIPKMTGPQRKMIFSVATLLEMFA